MADFIATVYSDTDPVSVSVGSVAYHDPILAETSAAFRCRFDPNFSFSYPGGAIAGRAAPAAPTNGQVVYDVSGRANGTFRLMTSDVVSWSKGGFDFSAVTALGSAMVMPSTTLASIKAASNAYFAVMIYMKMPTQANWFANAAVGWLPFLKTAAAAFSSEADLLTMIFPGVQGRLMAKRQNGAPAIGNVDTLQIDISNPACYGALCQIYYVRTATGQSFAIRPVGTGNTPQTATAAVGTENPNDYSGKSPQFGPGTGFAGYSTSDTGGANTATGSKFKMYDVTWMDLTAGGNPLATDSNGLTLFDRDHNRVIALIAASAAANGGISQIYN